MITQEDRNELKKLVTEGVNEAMRAFFTAPGAGGISADFDRRRANAAGQLAEKLAKRKAGK